LLAAYLIEEYVTQHPNTNSNVVQDVAVQNVQKYSPLSNNLEAPEALFLPTGHNEYTLNLPNSIQLFSNWLIFFFICAH